MNLPFRITILPAMLLLAASAGQAPAQTSMSAVPQPAHAFTGDLGVTFTAQRSLKALTEQSFWAEGGSLQLGMPVYRNLAAVIDYTVTHTGSIGSSGVPLTLETLTFGPRYRFHPHARLSPYAQSLFGLAVDTGTYFPAALSSQTNGSRTTATSFALVAGGGVDYRATSHLSIRMIDAAYVRSNIPNGLTNEQNLLRLGAGLVVRFGSSR